MVVLTLLGFLCFEFSGAKELDMMKTNAKVMLTGGLGRPQSNGVFSAPVKPDNDPVVVNQNPGNIVISFNVTYGNLSVRLINKTGLPVFTTNVNAQAGTALTINTQSLKTGTYTLKISDAFGGCLTGEINIP